MLRIGLVVLSVLVTMPAQAALKVVASMPDYAALAKAVGGQHVVVKSLAGESQDPHFVDAKPSYVVALNRADLLVINGLELEIGWMPTLLVQARNSKVAAGAPGHLDASTIVESILQIPTGNVDRSMGDIHPGGNPHYNHDPVRMLKMVDVLAARMGQLDPAHAADFESNRIKARQSIEDLIASARAKFGSLPAEARRVVEYHKSFIYLFETLGIEVAMRIEPKPGVAPSPAHIAQVVSKMRGDGIRVVVQENYAPTRVTQTIATITKSKHVVLPSGTRFDAGETYHEHIQSMVDALYAACKGL